MATYTELVAAAAERLNLTSAEALARLGRYLNTRYKRVTTSIGLVTSRRTEVQATATLGVQTLTFDAIEKIIAVSDRSSGSDVFLDEVSPEELTGALNNSASIGAGQPTRYAIYRMNKGSVQILMDTVPQTEFTLYAAGHATASTLSGAQEPGFAESYHDILLFGMLADEYKKLELIQYSKEAEKDFESRLSDLRFFIAKSAMANPYQGKASAELIGGVSGSGSGSGSGVNGATSYTQTGLITFDRDPSAPFAVTSGSAKVTNLDADLLDGQTGADYHNASLLATGDVPVARLSNGTTTVLIDSSTTGAVNNWAPSGMDGNTYVNWSGAGTLAVTGIAGGVSGQTFTFFNSSTGLATFAYRSGSSSEGNKLFNKATSGLTLVSTGGHVTYIYNGGDWVLVSHEQGAWVTLVYAAGNFTAATGTWGVDDADEVVTYRMDGTTLYTQFNIVSTDVSATPTSLRLTMPYTFGANNQRQLALASDAGASFVSGISVSQSASSLILFYSTVAANGWTLTSGDNTSLLGLNISEVT